MPRVRHACGFRHSGPRGRTRRGTAEPGGDGHGKGGRNQELALAAAIELDGLPGVALLSGGTDGTDGPTDAAGAVVDGATVARAAERGLDASEFLRRNDAYHFFQAIDEAPRDGAGTPSLLITGPTGTNVMDVCLTLIGQ